MRRRMFSQKTTIDANTLLLLHAEDFSDSSNNANTIANNGVTLTAGKFDNSFYFNGASNLSFAKLISGIADWTIECWVKITSISSTEQMIVRLGGIAYIDYPLACISIINGRINFSSYYNASSTGFYKTTTSAINTGVWHHIAFTKFGSNFYGFVDGVLVMTTTGLSNLGTASTISYLGYCKIKSGQSNIFWFTGYIDEFRVSNLARWTANFTPPNEAY